MAGQRHHPAKGRFARLFSEKRIVIICLFLAFGQFQYGYDSAAIAGFQGMVGFLEIFGYPDPEFPTGYNISTDVQRLIQSLMNVGGVIAAVIIYALGTRMSRRAGLWLASAIGLLAISLMIGVTSLGGLYAGRLLLGMSNGFLVPYTVMYMTESAPSLLRGSIVGMSTFQTSLGALFGILVDNYTDTRTDRWSWGIPMAVMYIVPVGLSTFLLFLPDTPRFYVAHGQDEKAIDAIRRLRGLHDEALLQAEVADIRNAYELEQKDHIGAKLSDMFRGSDRRRTFLCYALNVGQSATGVTFMAAYSVYFFLQAGVGKPFTWVMISLAIALTGNMTAFPAMRFIGRRTLLITCSLISAATMLAMAIIYTVSAPGSTDAGKALVALSIVYTWFYGVGQGPVLWALSTEIPSQRLRSQTVGTASGVNFVFAWLVAFFTPYFINPDQLNWGPKYGYIWAGSNVALAAFAFFFVPETKGRSLEQLDELFEKRVPARKFATFEVERRLVDGDEFGAETEEQVERNGAEGSVRVEGSEKA